VVAGATRKSLDKIHDDVEFYAHQLDGVRQLANWSSFILADDMGLGKSLQALTVAAIDFQRGRAARILIVCPAFLKWNWAEEIQEHTSFTWEVYNGTPAKRQKQRTEFDSDILICGYEQIANDGEELRALGWDILICDEAHAIKERSSKRSKAVYRMPAKRVFLLTGSPVLNRPNELWGLLHRVAPARFPSYWQFVNRFCNTPDAPILMADGTFKPLGKVEAGDEVVGWHVPEVSTARRGYKRITTDSANQRRMMVPSVVEKVITRQAEVYEFTLDDGSVIKCTPDHLWLAGNHARNYEWVPATPVDRGPHSGEGRVLSRIISEPEKLSADQQREADWLAGLCDGEATWPFIAQYRSANPAVWERIGYALDVLGFNYTTTDKGYMVLGGRQAIVNMLAWGNPVKRDKMMAKLYGQLNRQRVRVVSFRSIGVQTVVSMQTSTGNYIAWGLASKNCVFGGFKNKQIVGTKNKVELRGILSEYMLRRLKSDVLDLPDKQIIPVYVELHPEQKKVYDEADKELAITLPSDPDPMEIENAMVKMLRLKQIACTPATIGLDDNSYKLDRAIEMIEEFCLGENPEPVVVFTQFRGTMEAMRLRCDALGVPLWQLHGDVKNEKRIPMTIEWANEAKAGRPGVLMVMLQMSTGMNLTAARKAIFLDKLYVPKLNEQAQDRIHRIGADTTHPVQIFELIARGTVEERIEKILGKKRHLFKTLIEDVASWKEALMKEMAEEDH
jgi:hypothetical protein